MAYSKVVRKPSVVPALFLAAWLLPLAAQVGTLLQLLDAGRRPHPASMVELLVHGHPHGGRVPAHGHSAWNGPAAPVAEPRSEASPAVSGFAAPSGFMLPAPRPGRSGVAAGTLAAAPLRHLLFVVLLR